MITPNAETKWISLDVLKFSGLTAMFAKEVEANYLLRGVRNTTDFEYENTIAHANKNMNTDLKQMLIQKI